MKMYGLLGMMMVCFIGCDKEESLNCKNGFEELGGVCVDVDECTRGLSSCTEVQLCTNTVGDYQCEPIVAQTDECSQADEVSRCGANAQCVDNACVCETGYQGNGFDCQDMDECKQQQEICGINADCINEEGSYTCQCKDGFEGQDCDPIPAPRLRFSQPIVSIVLGESFSTQVINDGGPIVDLDVDVDNLPYGVNYNPETRTLSGTPQYSTEDFDALSMKTQAFTVTASNHTGTSTALLHYTVLLSDDEKERYTGECLNLPKLFSELRTLPQEQEVADGIQDIYATDYRRMSPHMLVQIVEDAEHGKVSTMAEWLNAFPYLFEQTGCETVTVRSREDRLDTVQYTVDRFSSGVFEDVGTHKEILTRVVLVRKEDRNDFPDRLDFVRNKEISINPRFPGERDSLRYTIESTDRVVLEGKCLGGVETESHPVGVTRAVTIGEMASEPWMSRSWLSLLRFAVERSPEKLCYYTDDTLATDEME